MTAFCACELRSPAPFTDEGFLNCNRTYIQTLERWGLYKDGVNPLARTNVCPAHDAPASPSLYAFSYTVRDIGALVEAEVVARGAARNGLNWHFCRPPVAGLDYEMDVRGVVRELLL